jgi:hypothetical protein
VVFGHDQAQVDDSAACAGRSSRLRSGSRAAGADAGAKLHVRAPPIRLQAAAAIRQRLPDARQARCLPVTSRLAKAAASTVSAAPRSASNSGENVFSFGRPASQPTRLPRARLRAPPAPQSRAPGERAARGEPGNAPLRLPASARIAGRFARKRASLKRVAGYGARGDPHHGDSLIVGGERPAPCPPADPADNSTAALSA